ncbi:MAG: hypothetical protein M1822_003914 [Bathelium mastoideum]|nr:MAG: hypothetical protein M1822_003914 [Bathelium mastoideum]
MSTPTPSQLFLLSDHVKLSILERQRARSLHLQGDQQDGHISRSLETLREGIEALERGQGDLDGSADSSQISSLRAQYQDLQSQFQGWPSSTSSNTTTLTSPNDPSLASDFSAAQQTHHQPRPSQPSSKRHHHHPRTSSLKRTSHHARTSSPNPKSVRFSDHSPSGSGSSSGASSPDPARAALFPYRDEPNNNPGGEGAADVEALSNQQVHAYHARVLADQDAQLDVLGQSIGRQRELSIQIGDELEDQVQLLDEVDDGVMRHQGQLDRAKRRLGGVARKARENWGMTVIAILIVVLVLLIILLK